MTLSQEDEEELGLSSPPSATVVELERKPRRPFQPWTMDDIENMPDLQWLIGNDDNPVLLEDGLWQTIGLLKSAKTFYTLEQAFCIAFGIPFHGLPTMRGQVIYILAEGGIKRNFKRVRALYDKHREAMLERGFASLSEAMNSNQLLLIDQTIKLANSQPAEQTSPESFIKELKNLAPRPALVILDTWARALWESGGHDSDQQTVGPSIQSLEMIRKQFGGCTLVMVAHIGASKGAQGRAKGLTDPAGAIDGGTLCRECTKGSGVFTFKAIHQRHAAEGFTITAQLVMPTETSASVVLVSSNRIGGAIDASRVPPSVRAWLEVLLALPGGSGTLLAWRKAGELAGVVKASGARPNPASIRKSFKRARDELLSVGAVSVKGNIATASLGSMAGPEQPIEFEDEEEDFG